MSTETNPGRGYQVVTDDLAVQANALSGIGEQTSSLLGTARELAARTPMLGTAPPALHLAMRLRETAGDSGLTGAITSADTELNGFHHALQATVTGYRSTDDGSAEVLRTAGESAT